MIKRRFYKVDHGDRDGPDPSSSSSDSELEVEPEASEDESEDYAIAEVKPNDNEAGSTSSGSFYHILLTLFCFHVFGIVCTLMNIYRIALSDISFLLSWTFRVQC